MPRHSGDPGNPGNPAPATATTPGDGDNGPQCRGVIEVEAESVAYLVTQAHGLDAGQYTFTYVAGWAQSAASATSTGIPVNEIITATGKRVIAAADRILTHTQPQPTIVDEALGALHRAVEHTPPAADLGHSWSALDARASHVRPPHVDHRYGGHAPTSGSQLS